MAHLSPEQRYAIGVFIKNGSTITETAALIGKDKSVVSRELSRNCDGRDGSYKAGLAQKKADKRLHEKPKKRYFTSQIEEYVVSFLKQDFSTEQIVGKASIDLQPCVSEERIYQFIWADKKAGGTYYKHLRTKGKKYRKRGSSKDRRGQIIGRVSIDQRPAEVGHKNRVGDLEMDLVMGKDHIGALLTINDRATGMLKMAKVESKEAAVIEQKAVELLGEWKEHLHTITSDNGKEFANHKEIAEKLMIDYFFAHPYHSWERGANENLNGLIRQYFPKKTSLENVKDHEIILVQEKLNNRPRKRFGFLTPNEVFTKAIQNNGIVAFVT